MFFEWDGKKAEANQDPNHSIAEVRSILLGKSAKRDLLVVVFTERGYRIRIISARKASRKKIRQYESEA